MHAAFRHGTPSLKSLSKDNRVSCFGRSSGRLPQGCADEKRKGGA